MTDDTPQRTRDSNLPSGEARLFLASPDDWAPETGTAAALGLLSEEERQRYDSFGHPLPKRLFLTGRALARSALSRQSDTRPEEWVFETGRHGRPRIAAPGRPTLDFNLAHTNGLVACLITPALACGVDVENTSRTLDPMRMAEHSFAPEEVAGLKCLAGQDRQDRFLAYWTLKEAYLKGRGAGFTLRLDAVAIGLSDNGVLNVRFADRTGDDPRDWQFELFRAPGDHLVAVAIQHRDKEPLDIVTVWAEPPPGGPADPERLVARPIALETIASNAPRSLPAQAPGVRR